MVQAHCSASDFSCPHSDTRASCTFPAVVSVLFLKQSTLTANVNERPLRATAAVLPSATDLGSCVVSMFQPGAPQGFRTGHISKQYVDTLGEVLPEGSAVAATATGKHSHHPVAQMVGSQCLAHKSAHTWTRHTPGASGMSPFWIVPIPAHALCQHRAVAACTLLSFYRPRLLQVMAATPVDRGATKNPQQGEGGA